MEVLTSVLVICAIGVFLAAVLTAAERYLADYGMCKILINGDREIEIKGGNNLLGSLTEVGIFIPSACGGRGSCGLCKVEVLRGAGPLLPTEKPYLSPEEAAGNIRLACQVKVREDLQISIPDELFNIKEYQAEVARIEDLTHDIKALYLKLKNHEEMKFTAGQYVQIRTPQYGRIKEEVYRAYSIASSESHPDEIQLIIRRVPEGICTTYIFDYLKEGDTIFLNGPHGEFYLRDSNREIVCIAGGSGLAPIKAILHHMAERHIGRKAAFYFGCVSKKDLYYTDEMKKFEDQLPNFRFIPALSSPEEGEEWSGETGLITDVVDRNIQDGSNVEAYLCGSPGMINACLKVLHQKGVSDDRIFYDKF